MDTKTVGFFVAGLIVAISVGHFIVKKEEVLTVNVPTSRIIMEQAMQIVRSEKPTPPQSSRFYAVVAKDYYQNIGTTEGYATDTLMAILAEIVKNDNPEIEIPAGEALWASPEKPFSPHAGEGTRFIVDENFTYQVPLPPEFKSELYNKNLEEVAQASLNRTPEQGAMINFWGGVPGTEAPAGIWQNRLWDVSQKYKLDDEKFAYAQMILAEAIADSFMECWEVKFVYWTKRPDMVDTTIQTAMNNPPFPGYVSGHSTISFTAATVLSKMFPEDAELYIANATEAKNSRLWAGIHFPYDNDEGEKLGVAVGEYIAQKLQLKAVN